MVTNVKSKAGISLIVLVITIIVMIILATAIILSISNSGIIDKANKAKTDSDMASAKEVVAMAKADWDLMDMTKQSTDWNNSFSAYAEKKLEEAGFGTGKYFVDENGNVTTEKITILENGKNGIIINGDELSLDDNDIVKFDSSGDVESIKENPEFLKLEGAVKIPDTIKTVKNNQYAQYALKDKNSKITKLIFGDNVESISAIFSRCNLVTSIEFNNKLTTIGDLAFQYCTSLQTVTIPSSVRTIGYNAFADCTSLKEVTILEGTTQLGESVFERCTSLKTINLPKSVKNMEQAVLPEKSDGLTINYAGTKAEFKKVSITLSYYQYYANEGKYNLDNYVINCTDGSMKLSEL